jgi:uncharacterized protein (DUF433 family)
MVWRERIVIDPAVLAGKPAVKDTCLSVELILGWLAQGWTVDNLLDSYPRLVRDDVLSALAFSADAMRRDPGVARRVAAGSATTVAHDSLGQANRAPTAPNTGWRGRIVAASDTLSGRPRIAGTRIGVDFVLDLLGSGWSATRVVDEYAQLKPDDLTATLAFAQDFLREQHVA